MTETAKRGSYPLVSRIALLLLAALALSGCAVEQYYAERDICRKKAETPYEYQRCDR